MSSKRRNHATLNVAARAHSLDRVLVAERESLLVIALADGAGGMAGGAEAADALIAAVTSFPASEAVGSKGTLAGSWLESIDGTLSRSSHGGECTAVVVVVADDAIVGASIGDSCAWICGVAGVMDLTHAQRRKPLVGSGRAIAVPFASTVSAGRLMVASDGLWKYAERARLVEAAMDTRLQHAMARLHAAVTLPAGGLQDDLSVALVELDREASAHAM